MKDFHYEVVGSISVTTRDKLLNVRLQFGKELIFWDQILTDVGIGVFLYLVFLKGFVMSLILWLHLLHRNLLLLFHEIGLLNLDAVPLFGDLSQSIWLLLDTGIPLESR